MYVHILVAEAFLENTEHLPEVDHRDCNPKNNKLSNLRWCTIGQQNANRSGWGKSKCKGVSWHEKAGKWKSEIGIANKHYYLGLYESEAEASNIYDFFAWMLFKEFARLNTTFKRNYTPEMVKKINDIVAKYNFQL